MRFHLGEDPQIRWADKDHEAYREVRTAVLASMAAWLAKVKPGRTTCVTAAELLAAFPVEGDSP